MNKIALLALLAVPAFSIAHTAPLDLKTKRSEERRVGKECVQPCRSRWSPYH